MTRFVKFTSPIHDKSVYIDASKVKSVTYDPDGHYVKVGGVLVKEDMDTVMRILTECYPFRTTFHLRDIDDESAKMTLDVAIDGNAESRKKFAELVAKSLDLMIDEGIEPVFPVAL